MSVAEIYLNQTNKRIDKVYDYIVPEGTLPGQRVCAPFGSSRQLEGFIVSIKQSSKYASRLKPVVYVIDEKPVLDSRQIALCLYLKEQTHCLFYEALALFTAPVRTQKQSSGTIKAFSPPVQTRIHLIKEAALRGPVQQAILNALKASDQTYEALRREYPSARSVLRRFDELGLIETSTEPEGFVEAEAQLSPQWAKRWARHRQPLAAPAFVKLCTQEGLYALVASEYRPGAQTLVVFANSVGAREFEMFMKKRCALSGAFYSGGDAQRDKYWFYQRVRSGAAELIIGTSAALFLPYKNLRSVIVIEAGHPDYYPAGAVSYEPAALFEKLCALHDARLIKTDVIETVESRPAQCAVPAGFEKPETVAPPEVVEMNREMRAGNFSMLSGALETQIEACLKHGKKALLLFNRKGYGGSVFCRDCGAVLKCPSCQSVLEYTQDGRLLCRSCRGSFDVPECCPECGSRKIRAARAGIGALERCLKERFPGANIAKVTKETAERQADADIIIGTQKLLSVPVIEDVALAAAVLIDLDINFPDYTAPERALRLYKTLFLRYPQARHLIQTYQADHSVVQALGGAETAFTEEQLLYRQAMKLPPFYDLFVFTISAPDAAQCAREAALLHKRFSERLPEDARILPVFALPSKAGRCVSRFIVKADKDSDFRKIIDCFYREGEIEALLSAVSLQINPPEIL